MAEVLLVEDEDLHATLIREVLPDSLSLQRARTLKEAREALAERPMDLVLLDYGLPDGNGLSLLDDIRKLDPEVPVIFVTALNDARTGIAALRGGAKEYVVKDEHYLEELPLLVDKALGAARLEARSDALRVQVSRYRSELSLLREQTARGEAPTIVGNSHALAALRRSIVQASRSAETLLITGETGTGKELVARDVHAASERRTRPFIAVNCAAFPETLLEAEFFGYKKGAFTGAGRDKEGILAAVREGSLFLDEIGELPAATQAKLLRVLQEREFTPVGGTKPHRFLGRVLAATNVDLENATREGLFRHDLYYRLNVVPLRVPPLREHREDIPELVEHFVRRYNERNRTSFGQFPSAALSLLADASWPGNVRELENVVSRVLACLESADSSSVTKAVEDEVDRSRLGSDQSAIIAALEHHRWNRAAAAAELGISRTTLWRKMIKYNLASA